MRLRVDRGGYHALSTGRLERSGSHKFVFGENGLHAGVLLCVGGLLDSDVASVRTEKRVRLLALLYFFVLHKKVSKYKTEI